MRVLAFYLPQYHPIPENDAWWGDGFTDWVNVAKAKPRFKGHHQPQIPADLGFYDLRLEEVRIAQAELAAASGISGFCYYHYWFNGKMLLERPFNEVLRSGKPDFPFCLCWANENWTRRWDGLEEEILIDQHYNKTDRINHITWLCNAFRDARYIKVNNKPLLLIYRTDTVPDLKERISDWRRVARENGFEDLYLCAVRSNFPSIDPEQSIACGVDAIVEFQPYQKDLPGYAPLVKLQLSVGWRINKLIQKLNLEPYISPVNLNCIYNYAKLADKAMRNDHPQNYVQFPCVTPSWDNTPRRKTSLIIQNDDPRVYKRWLLHAMKRVENYSRDEQIVFINAWNEWGEGCHLEPDLRNGKMFLESTKDAVGFYSKKVKLDVNP